MNSYERNLNVARNVIAIIKGGNRYMLESITRVLEEAKLLPKGEEESFSQSIWASIIEMIKEQKLEQSVIQMLVSGGIIDRGMKKDLVTDDEYSHLEAELFCGSEKV